MFPFRKPSPFTRITDQTPLRLLPKPVEAMTLLGFIAEPGLPFAPPPVLGVQVVTSPVNHHVFPQDARSDLDDLVGIHCWTDGPALTADLGPLAQRLLVRFPAEFPPAEFPDVFANLALISITHNRLAEPILHTCTTALLHDPGPDAEHLRAPRALHTLLSRSDGSTSLPDLMLDQASGDVEMLGCMTRAVAELLPDLLGRRIAAVMEAR